MKRNVAVEIGKEYRLFGVKWWGQGTYERKTVDGGDIRAKQLSIIREGDLVINKIWVRHGSSAIVPPKLDGCAATSEFPSFVLDDERIEHRWLHYLFKTKWFWHECSKRSQGTSGKNRIRPDEYLKVEIPLPPLEEQQRIVTRIEALAGKVGEARRLREKATAEVDALWSGSLGQAYDHATSVAGGIEELQALCLKSIKGVGNIVFRYFCRSFDLCWVGGYQGLKIFFRGL